MKYSKYKIYFNNNAMMNSGIYIHIPFCVRKCNYCAFLSDVSNPAAREEYVEKLIREFELRSDEFARQEYDSIYFGGGTPSLLEPDQIDGLIKALRDNYRISEDAEITLEANPGTLGDSKDEVRDRLRQYKATGINRLSMGVQSMDDERLKFLGRIHDSETVKRDFELAREVGYDNINLDIIFSVPGESLEEALTDISQIAELGAEHVSFYSLQLEEDTYFFDLWERHEIEEVDDETDRRTYHEGCKLLAQLGYEHYEISNFAKGENQYRSRHNSKYWSMEDYLAFGLGASGFMTDMEGQRIRYKNVDDFYEYIRLLEEEKLPTADWHINDEFDTVSETVFTGLRRREGVRYDACFGGVNAEARFWQYYSCAREDAESFVQSGHLLIDESGIRLTEAGIDISNKIMSLFV